ncbi:DUF2285 domain-containing protein [Phenylobacterium sp.]|uniref:DUF2285 domain-containing protein n=1 Tax=Phenylobacterium sp. TaxID=1871053 RepID=UPI0035B2A10F
MFWSPDADLATVVLGPALPDLSSVATPSLGPPRKAPRISREGHWRVQGTGRFTVHLLLLREARPGHPLAIVTPFDADGPARLAMAARAWRILHDAPEPIDDQLTFQRRRRLAHVLRAHDGRTAGASHRQIANALFGAERVADGPWKSSALRDQTLRLVRDGAALVTGGYRRLLRPSRISR